MSSPASNANRQNLEFGPSQNSNLAERHLRRTTRVGAGMQSAVHWSSSSRLVAMPSSLPRSPAPPHRRLPTSRRATFTAPPGTNLATSAAAALHASLSPPAEPSHLPTSRSASPEPDGEARGADSSVSGSPAPQPPGPPDMPAAPDARELRLTCPVLGCAHPAGVNGRGFLGKRGYVRHLDAVHLQGVFDPRALLNVAEPRLLLSTATLHCPEAAQRAGLVAEVRASSAEIPILAGVTPPTAASSGWRPSASGPTAADFDFLLCVVI